MIWFDRTSRSVVVGCRQCGTRRLFNHQGEADGWVVDHLNRAHPGPSPEQERAITAARQRRARQ